MKAAILPHRGGPDLFVLDEVDDLPLGPTDISVTVAAAAINPVDIKTRSGFLDIKLQFPAVLGWDVSGVVDAVGEDVSRFAPGDAVIGMIAQPAHRYGTYADRVVADHRLFASAPASVPLPDAAGIPLAGLTAVQTLQKLALPAPARVLVTGGAGAVGRIAIQLLLEQGHTVGAVARASDREDLHGLGVSSTTTADAIADQGWDAVVDTAGIAASIAAVRDNGQFVSIADNEQPEEQREIIPCKSYVDEDGFMLATLVDAIDAGRLNISAARSYALAEVGQAHAQFETGGVRGKILVIP